MNPLSTIRCPECGFEGRIPQRYVGKQLKCRQCAALFTPTAAESPITPPDKSQAPARAWTLDEVAAQVLLQGRG